MFRFANETYLNFLWLIPVLLVLAFWMMNVRRKKMEVFAGRSLWQDLMPDLSFFRMRFKFLFFLIALSGVIVALARPQFGSKLKEVKREGVELIIALDVSNSMLATDVRPDRLQRAKMAIEKLVEKLEDDRFGLIVFAGDAYVQVPVTTDFSAVKLFLSSVNTDIVPKQGTAIGSAIELAMKSFDPTSELEKAIIVLTDGENHEDNAIEAANKAKEKGVTVYTIGLGSPEGSPIPVKGSYGQRAFRKDASGQTVISKLDEQTLNKIAVAGGGEYYRASTSDVGLKRLFRDISQMEEKEIESRVYSDYDDQFQYFLGLSLIFLFLDAVLLEKKNRYFNKLKLFGKINGKSQG